MRYARLVQGDHDPQATIGTIEIDAACFPDLLGGGEYTLDMIQ